MVLALSKGPEHLEKLKTFFIYFYFKNVIGPQKRDGPTFQ